MIDRYPADCDESKLDNHHTPCDECGYSVEKATGLRCLLCGKYLCQECAELHVARHENNGKDAIVVSAQNYYKERRAKKWNQRQ